MVMVIVVVVVVVVVLLLIIIMIQITIMIISNRVNTNGVAAKVMDFDRRARPTPDPAIS